MNKLIYLLCIMLFTISCVQSQNPNKNIKQDNMKYNKLTTEEERVIIHKGTEAP